MARKSTPFLDGVEVSLIREDLAHLTVPGPKFYRLEAWLSEAEKQGYREVWTTGGPWSNHIHGLAVLAAERGMSAKAVIRGYQDMQLNALLLSARAFGMDLEVLPRSEFDLSREHGFASYRVEMESSFYIPLGAGGDVGHGSMKRMVNQWMLDGEVPDWIAMTAGTGSTLAGVVEAMPSTTRVFVAAPFKDPSFLWEQIVPAHRERVILTGSISGRGFGKPNLEAQKFTAHWAGRQGVKVDNLYMPNLLMQLVAHQHLFGFGEKLWILLCGGSPYTILGES